MKKVLYLLLLFIIVVGLLGGIGYSIYQGAWVVAIGLVAAGFVAYPGIKILIKKLTD